MSTFILRPSNSEKEAFRVKLSAASLLGLKLKPGDLCIVKSASSIQDADDDLLRPMSEMSLVPSQKSSTQRSVKYAIAWEASGLGMKDTVVQMSKFLQDLHGFKLGDKVVIERSNEVLQEARNVKLAKRWEDAEAWDGSQKDFWEYYARLTVKGSHECIAQGEVLTFKVGQKQRAFQVIDTGSGEVSIAKIGEDTKFEILGTEIVETQHVDFSDESIGGLKKEVEEMQRLVTRLLSPRISKNYSPVQGVLVYGAKGVGKSRFIDELSRSGWSAVLRWSPGVKVPTPLRSTLIIIDQLDMPSSQTAPKALLREIDRLFCQIQALPAYLLARLSIPMKLTLIFEVKGRFAAEIEIPIPSATHRKEILTVMRGSEPLPTDEILYTTAFRTHGYVAADLKALLRRTLELASEADPSPTINGDLSSQDHQPSQSFTVTSGHLDTALTQIRPSALQEIFLETPSTRYTDIGGHHLLKQQLQNAVTRPLTQASRMAKLGLKPKKGVLLYGPPGCSKTLLVRALANEAKLNFLAVKGAELISMYVGESERATREVFRKARAASPSIIFFDEIDAIATRSRSGGGGGDLNVLTTLLNEMDGFEELKNVFVVAATNKPESIDAALLRPGRFDNVVYIGPPDTEARKEIFEKRFRASSYQPAGTSLESDAQRFAAQTEGFSGAEIVAIVQSAAEFALDNERDYYTSEDIEKAIAKTPKSITKEMLDGFEAWNAARMR